MLHELGSAVRSVVRRPVLALAVMATLTVAIGANAVIFAIADAVLLAPLPYPDSDRLVSIYELNKESASTTRLVAPVRLQEWHERNRAFVGLAGSYFENLADTTGALPERVAAMRVTPRFFQVLGVTAALGRTFTDQEEHTGGPLAIVVSDGFWRRRLDADPAVIGRALTVGGQSRTIVGVMPPSFRYPSATTEMWVPAPIEGTPLERARLARFLTAVGRLKPGVTPEQAAGDLSAVQQRLGEEYPETDAGWGASVLPLKEEQVGNVRRTVWLLLGAVALLLLTACGNIACLMLAEASRREHEITVRLALGASRRALVRQLLLEALVLALAGAAGGVLVAGWGTALLPRAAGTFPRIEEVHVSAWLVGVTFVLGAAATALFGLVPAVRAVRQAAGVSLARSDRAVVRGRQPLRSALVSAQVAMAITLLTGAGLLARSFAYLQDVPLGFDGNGVWMFRMSAQWNERPDGVTARQARTVDRLQAVPGVEAAGITELPPAAFATRPTEFQLVGRDLGERQFAVARSVSAGYFAALHIPLLAGTTCESAPSARPFSEALVTRAFADRFLSGEAVIGQELTTPEIRRLPTGTSARILGLVDDVREGGAAAAVEPVIYLCGYNPYWPDPYFLVRTRPDRPASMDTIRAALREIEPNRAVYDVQRLDDAVAGTLSRPRLNALLLALFAGTALFLAAIGLYGVLAQIVASERREIGVRLAIGANRGHIAGRVLAHAAALTGVGIAAGVAGALALAGLMTSLVAGIPARDPVTFAVVPLVLLAVAGLAASIPAHRAARIDPSIALRDE